MRILITLTYYHPYISGLAKYAKKLAECLSEEGKDVKVLTMKYAGYLKGIEKTKGVTIVRANPLFKVGKGFLSVDWAGKALTGVIGADVVIINLPQPEALLPALWAKLLSKKIIVIYHCDVVLPGSKHGVWITRIIDGIHRLIINSATHVVTNTEDYAKNSRVLIDYLDKLTYIYPLVEKQFSPIKAGVKNKWIIGFVGRMAQEKGLEYLLETIPLLTREGWNIEVRVVGPKWTAGEEDYKNKITRMMEKHHKKAKLLGQLDGEQLIRFYRDIDVLVLPSLNSTESFGMVQMEAMMSGVPVVATDIPGVRTAVAKTGMGILVKPKDSKGLADAIIKVFSNVDNYKSKQKSAIAEFDISKGLEKYEHLLLS